MSLRIALVSRRAWIEAHISVVDNFVCYSYQNREIRQRAISYFFSHSAFLSKPWFRLNLFSQWKIDLYIYIYICIPLQTKPRNPFSILKPFKQTQSNFAPTVFSQEENRGQNFRCRSHSSNAETGAKERPIFLLFKCCYVKLSASQHQLENNRTHSALTCASVRKQRINQTNFTMPAVIFPVWTWLVSWNRPES